MENKFSHLVDSHDKIYCRICGKFYTRIYGLHIRKVHNMTIEEYKEMFPDAPVQSQKLFNYLSNRISGKNNPNHKSKTTESERKSRSPFSNDFINYKDLTEEEKEVVLKEQIKNINKIRVPNTQLEYYIRQGHTIEEAKEMLSKRQTTFSLKICIEKYGEEEGKKRWEERQDKWLTSLHENGNLKMGFSKVSQALFDKILEHYDEENKEFVDYALKSKEFSLYENYSLFNYDFVDRKQMKIIEFNGDIFHANPNIYAPWDIPNPHRPQLSAEQIWMQDLHKKEIAEKNGYEYFIVWEYQHRIEPKIVFKNCLEFLNLK